MAKRVSLTPEWLKASGVSDIYSVSSCVSDDFGDYIQFWKHNEYGFFNSPADILGVAAAAGIELAGTSLFYYDVHPEEFDGETWVGFERGEAAAAIQIIAPKKSHLEGFDVVTFSCGANPECSPLSCNSMATELPTNSHCLFATFHEAWESVNRGVFNDSEPGPYRILAVYSVDWPEPD
jgi:hypothetical protein